MNKDKFCSLYFGAYILINLFLSFLHYLLQYKNTMVTQVVTNTNDNPPSRPPSLPEKSSSPEKPTCAHPDFIVVKMHRNQYVSCSNGFI